MANLTITNTFTANTTAASAQVNTNFTDVKTWLNNRDNASDYWLNMKVSATVSNPSEIKSSSTDCEFDIDCTGTNGTPRISWRRSGSTYFTVGVDGAASNLLKFGTTALTTNVAMQIPTTGAQVQFANGSVSAPSLSFVGFSTYGFWKGGSTSIAVAIAGAIAGEWTQTTCSLYTNGSEAFRIDATGVAGNTALLIYDASAAALVRVSRGAADSGGAGFRLLRVPN